MAIGTSPANPTTTEDWITVTPRAIEEIKTILSAEDMPDETLLRVGIMGGGCAGFQYHMALEDEAQEDDEVIEIKEVKMVVDPVSFQYLKGVTIDFQEGVHQSGFVFDNPNASSTCGCGQSFQT